MLIAIIGENCVGKSTLANIITERFAAELYSGKDYLRMEKNPSLALERFKTMLTEAVTGKNIIYVITEKEHISLLPKGAVKIVLTAELETIKERFKTRMRGNLPLPLEKMLEAKHGMYDDLPCDLKIGSDYDAEEICGYIASVNNLKAENMSTNQLAGVCNGDY